MGRIEYGYYLSDYTAPEIEHAIEISRIMKTEDTTLACMKAHICSSCGAPMPTPFYCEYCGTHYGIGGGREISMQLDGEAVARSIPHSGSGGNGASGPGVIITYNSGRMMNGMFYP